MANVVDVSSNSLIRLTAASMSSRLLYESSLPFSFQIFSDLRRKLPSGVGFHHTEGSVIAEHLLSTMTFHPLLHIHRSSNRNAMKHQRHTQQHNVSAP